MKDFYKEKIEKIAMEKIAARAWKKFLPRLSDSNYSKLLNAGVYNPDKELQGFRRGTQNIFNKYDSKLIRSPQKAKEATKELGIDHTKFVTGKAPKSEEIKEYLSDFDKKKGKYSEVGPHALSRAMNPSKKGIDRTPVKALNGKSGYAYVPKNEHNSYIKNNPHVVDSQVKQIPRRDRDQRKWSQALSERHEADEIRYGEQLAKKANKKGKIANDYPEYFSHVSPKVLAQESANAALVPRTKTPNQHTAMRKMTKENESVKDLTGREYGSSAVYDKKSANKAEKYFLQTGNTKHPTANLKKKNKISSEDEKWLADRKARMEAYEKEVREKMGLNNKPQSQPQSQPVTQPTNNNKLKLEKDPINLKKQEIKSKIDLNKSPMATNTGGGLTLNKSNPIDFKKQEIKSKVDLNKPPMATNTGGGLTLNREY